MTRWERELKAIVKAACGDNFLVSKTRKGHFKVTLQGPKGREIVYVGGILKDSHAVHNVRAEMRKRAELVGAM